jgi:preprotein translocase subunit SecD
MRRKKALIYLAGVFAVALLALGFTFKVGNAPLLGLDLEGGVSVVLQPTTTATDDQIDQAITIMNQRINSLGVAEPDIHQQGNQIIVQIAGLSDQDKDKAIALVGQTAELRFRPVLCSASTLSSLGQTPGCSTLTAALSTPTTTPGTTPGTQPTTTGTAAVGTGNASDSTTPPTGSPGGNQSSMGAFEGESAAGIPSQTTPSTVSDQPATTAPAVGATSGSTPPGSVPAAAAAGAPVGAACQALSTTAPTGVSNAEQDNAVDSVCKQVILREDPRMVTGTSGGDTYLLGPACQPPEGAADSCLTGAALDSAKANIDSKTGKWMVNPVFKDGPEGIDKFNKIANACFTKAANCPTGQLAMTLDGYVVSAPTINAATFAADQIQISGSFTEDTAKNLATSLNYGALPVQFARQSAQQVSATIGRDALNAGLAAGIVGFILVTIYMIAFYRILGALAVLKLTVEGALLWSIISYLGASAGLALTLAGVTGIIVSIGVSLDSNVVYYEHLREDLRNGRTLRSAVDRSFSGAITTIWKADGASLLGAVLLYLLAVGPVRGFAFFLGLSTILDLISSYFYMHPVVYLATQTKLCQRRPGLFGLGGALAKETAGAEVAPATTRARDTTPTRPSKRSGRSGSASGEPTSSRSKRGAVALAEATDDGSIADEVLEDAATDDELIDDEVIGGGDRGTYASRLAGTGADDEGPPDGPVVDQQRDGDDDREEKA